MVLDSEDDPEIVTDTLLKEIRKSLYIEEKKVLKSLKERRPRKDED